MPIKRSSPETQSERPLKQAKLYFGQKMPPKPASSASSASSAASASTKAKGKGKPPPRAQEAEDEEAFDPDPSKAKNGFTFTEQVGDIFDAPDHTVIIHACNCVGSWGAGIAAAFRSKYPKAFAKYKSHCNEYAAEDLITTALLIPALETQGPKHWVGCLFTSQKYGRSRDSPKQILEATLPAMEDLISQMAEAEGIREIRMCQINSGLFSVPWERSRALLESIEVEGEIKVPKEITVYSLSPPT